MVVSLPLELNADISLSEFFAPHSGQMTFLESAFEEKINSSKTCWQLLHLNSYIGMPHILHLLITHYLSQFVAADSLLQQQPLCHLDLQHLALLLHQ